ncbi:MAG: alpha/beta fold hydrolase [Deltaproteobacteria bacterium]|nr:alpha/beta fold hydrolase [Deltaproteobacteria bacterium]
MAKPHGHAALVVLGAALAIAACATPPPPVRAERPASPVILVHGFSGWHELGVIGAYFNGVRKALADDGIAVYDPPLPPYGDVLQRAPVLARAIDAVLRRTGAAKVHLVAHSQGGIDARYVVDVLGYGDRVATIVTISTPHRGTVLADVAARVPGALLDPIFTLVGHQITAGAGGSLGEPDIRGSLRTLSVAGASALDARMTGDARVRGFSIAGVTAEDADGACVGGAWPAPTQHVAAGSVWPLWAVIQLASEGPGTNDGMVPTASMRWATFLGCVPADHIDEIGLTRSPALDHLAFYRRIVTGLAVLERTGSDEMLRQVGVATAPPR